MSSEKMERRLAAILAADVVGFSRLVGVDEEGTIARLQQLRKDLIDPRIASHNGRLVKTTGDGILIEFPSIVDAVRFAVEAQEAVAGQNAQTAEDRRIEFRVGINLGDVVVQDDDILGDGVNVAARLEGLADPGGICISGTVYDQVAGKLGLTFEDLGLREVKNIAEPVRVYSIQLGANTADLEPPAKPVSRMLIAIAGVALAGIIIAAGSYFLAQHVRTGDTNEAHSFSRPNTPAIAGSSETKLGLPDKPSIAVLAFDNMSSDPKQEYFADGMSEDLITGLSKVPALFVIARNSSFQYKGKAIDVKRIGDELGVRYVVEGSVRRSGDRIRINAQLIDTRTGGHIWAERYDGSLSDVFALQDQVTGQIIQALSVSLGADDVARLADHGTKSVEAHDAFLKGQKLARGHTLDDIGKAVEYFKEALEIDPEYSRASAAIAQIYYHVWRDDAGMGRQAGLPWPNDAARLAKEYVKKALEKPVPAAHIAQALFLQPGRRYDEAIGHAQAAIALDPNDPQGYLGLANLLVLAGRPQRALVHFERARRLDPHNQVKVDQGLGLAYFGLDRFEEAAQLLEKSRDVAPKDNITWMYLAATYAYLDRMQKAADAVKQTNALRLSQGINTFRADMIFLWFFKEKSDEDRLKNGLIKAGFPAKSF